MIFMYVCYFLFFKQKTAYEMRISDWSSDVCSSDLDRFLEIFGDRIAVDQHLSALLVDHDRGAARGVEVDKFVAPLPRRFAHQFVAHALFAEQKADFAREGTQGELIELPNRHGIAAGGRWEQRLCGGGRELPTARSGRI